MAVCIFKLVCNPPKTQKKKKKKNSRAGGRRGELPDASLYQTPGGEEEEADGREWGRKLASQEEQWVGEQSCSFRRRGFAAGRPARGKRQPRDPKVKTWMCEPARFAALAAKLMLKCQGRE